MLIQFYKFPATLYKIWEMNLSATYHSLYKMLMAVFALIPNWAQSSSNMAFCLVSKRTVIEVYAMIPRYVYMKLNIMQIYCVVT